MNRLVKSYSPAFLDLGCSGGQLVADFRSIGWISVGLEGSDYSFRHERANWKKLAYKNLFVCDITKFFQISPPKFSLITAWEVLEHIKTEDLHQVFRNIIRHLSINGYFIASTAQGSSVVDGVELHQTRWSNAEWRKFIEDNFPELTPVDLGLTPSSLVRYDFNDPSILTYQHK